MSRKKRSQARLKVIDKISGVSLVHDWVRRGTTLLTLAILTAVPWFELARLDFFGGAHRFLGSPVGVVRGVFGMLVALFVFYFVTFAVNLLLGRVFCGFGCPGGELHRLADATHMGRKAGFPLKIRRWGVLLGYALLLSAASMFWISVPARDLGSVSWWITLAALAVALVLHARFWRWKFCNGFCPIGMYYSVVQTNKHLGIQFDEALCTDCNLCTVACPANLDPRNLIQPYGDRGGIAIEDMAGRNYCLTCMECVRACRYNGAKGEHPQSALRYGLARRS